MNKFRISHTRHSIRTCGGGVAAAILLSFVYFPCHAHDEAVHEELAMRAFLSSGGVRAFFLDSLGVSDHYDVRPTLCTRPGDYPPNRFGGPIHWLAHGSYMEDDEDPTLADKHFLRSSDHFYTPFHTPLGLTDTTETHWLPHNITDSFTWATVADVQGPDLKNVFAGSNNQRWGNARVHEYYAVSDRLQSDRYARLALALYALGHVLHLNQDLSQPDHVRNDTHTPLLWGKRWIEDYGRNVYLSNARESSTARDELFPKQAHDWSYWRTNGFEKLLDFWDRGKYTGQVGALNEDADRAPGKKLGLAEYTNGNFIGEDAKYAEYFAPGAVHYFPFPKLTSTTFRAVRASFGRGVRATEFRDRVPGNRVFVDKDADGAHLANHSVLMYHATHPILPWLPSTLRVSTTIDDEKVLRSYHTNLVPKAIEYSAGILDYFFRGRLQLGCQAQANGSEVTFCIKNISGQTMKGGTLELYAEDNDSDKTRTPVPGLYPEWSAESMLESGASREFAFTAPTPPPAQYILAYKGTIGVDGAGNPLDPVDAGRAIATVKFTVEEQQGPGYGCTVPGEKRVAAMRRWHGVEPFTFDLSAPNLPTTRYLTATARATTTYDNGYGSISSAFVERSASVAEKSGRVTGTGNDALSGPDGDRCRDGIAPPNFPNTIIGAQPLACGMASQIFSWLRGLFEGCVPRAGIDGSVNPPEHGLPSINGDPPFQPTERHLWRSILYPYVQDGITNHHVFLEAECDLDTGVYWCKAYRWDYDTQTGTWSQTVRFEEHASETATSRARKGWDTDQRTTWTAAAGLSRPNTWEALNQDVHRLLATWDLADDEQFPWTSCCGDGVLVTRKEGQRAFPNVAQAAGNWTVAPVYSPARAGFQEGEIVGAPVAGPGPYSDPDRGGTSPFAHAIQWLSNAGEMYTEPGALVRFPVGYPADMLLKAKWATQKNDYPPLQGNFVFATGNPMDTYLTASQTNAGVGTSCSRAVMAVSPNGEHFPAGQPLPLASPVPLADGTVWFGMCYSSMLENSQYVEARADGPQSNWVKPIGGAMPPGCFDSYYPPR